MIGEYWLKYENTSRLNIMQMIVYTNIKVDECLLCHMIQF